MRQNSDGAMEIAMARRPARYEVIVLREPDPGVAQRGQYQFLAASAKTRTFHGVVGISPVCHTACFASTARLLNKTGVEMAGYLIANIEVKDPAKFEEYRQKVVPVIQKFGGRYLIRGGDVRRSSGWWFWSFPQSKRPGSSTTAPSMSRS
jgi:Domain of unknown function (DUF1330)